jgi:hypothetical protein
MITKEQFAAIEQEVEDSLSELFGYIAENCEFEDYLFLLADGEYKAEMQSVSANPHVIDYIINKRMDRSRMEFFSQFAGKYYSFDGFVRVENDSYRAHLEMMIYTHVWESEHFLKQLFRLSELISSGNYAWSVTVPPMGKHEFIRTDIRSKFEAKGLSIAAVMKKGYHSSLRNAFAHSQYYYNTNNQEIELANFGGATWELREITFDAWSSRFCYSIWLNYKLHVQLHHLRINIANGTGSNRWTINYPNEPQPIKIEYNVESDTFAYSQ